MKPNLKTFWNLHKVAILLALLSLLFYGVFAYDLNRSDSLKLLSLVGAITLTYFKLIQFEKFNFLFLTISGILFRLIFWGAIPNLSPDFFRFIWDGQLLKDGYNPYLFTPDQWMAGAGPVFPLAEFLYSGMSELSAQHYSNYPPVNQYLFAIAAFLGGNSFIGNLLALRTMSLMADLGILYFGRKLLRQFNKAPHLVFWYFLNPMIIIELNGNLHFEGVMLVFFIIGYWMITRGNLLPAALLFSLSIATKLVPLMLLPLVLPLLGRLRSIVFYFSLAIFLVACGLPLYNPEGAAHYLETLGLWFSNFEFNAGVYNVAEWMANTLNIPSWKFIKRYGAVIPWLTAASALLLALHPKMRQSKFWGNGVLGVLTVYYATAAVVHPWYLAFPLLISLFTRWRFPLWWSLLSLLSYTAYRTTAVQELTAWLWIEYIIVFGVLAYEFFNLRKQIVTDFKKSVN